jgi:hypothetical protein
MPTSADGRALTDWAQEVVGDLVGALNVRFDGVTETVALVPRAFALTDCSPVWGGLLGG